MRFDLTTGERSEFAGTGRPFVIACRAHGIRPGRPAIEHDQPDESSAGTSRIGTLTIVLGLADQGVRGVVVRPAPSVNDDGRNGSLSFTGALTSRWLMP
ncbi:hypothetical protein [Amycolatopsis sp. WQ 127309]|uniref:hypothetical protein n=1 Tax=Amycolatopsis sp. WQ 127309 TaxID=2932773 RepID=UPI001FF62E89|nr:hypothetical protein [Amycolatopsis sp. WQ 127309]UOZ05540.1 hypothetical protein MUY22_43045 [Amycolatopsis sp. WQ 127309]